MKNSIIKGKVILAVGSQMSLLQAVRGKILSACPECQLEMAATFGDGRQLMRMITYNLLILDMKNTLWRNLIDLAANRDFPVLALSDNGSSDEAIHRSSGRIIRAALPRENLNEIVPTVEKVLKYESTSNWKRALESCWHALIALGPGYPTKHVKENSFGNEAAIYIYY